MNRVRGGAITVDGRRKQAVPSAFLQDAEEIRAVARDRARHRVAPREGEVELPDFAPHPSGLLRRPETRVNKKEKSLLTTPAASARVPARTR